MSCYNPFKSTVTIQPPTNSYVLAKYELLTVLRSFNNCSNSKAIYKRSSQYCKLTSGFSNTRWDQLINIPCIIRLRQYIFFSRFLPSYVFSAIDFGYNLIQYVYEISIYGKRCLLLKSVKAEYLAVSSLRYHICRFLKIFQ